MSDDLVFGEVQMAEPEKALRPDRNKHYAVVALDEPKEGELPIYIDLDVMRDIEVHAASDKTVELGGVLLGGQHHDDDGQPFVVITDSLRAQHYESTKGSFKFTHETWSAISRERDEFPADCQMVGWYHTHPDWGVFLSGMDMFICNNFFNKPLDVAYVVDPCRGDRGMFQWTTGRKPTANRTGGFYLIASRFRQEELEDYVAALKGEVPMPAVHDRSGTVVNLHGQQPQWMGPAVLGMLTLQFCLLALVAYKMTENSASSPATTELARLLDERRAEEREKTQTETLAAVLKELKGTPEGYVASLKVEKEKSKELNKEVTVLKDVAALRESERKSAAEQLASMTKEKNDLEKDLAAVRAKRDKLEAKVTALEKSSASDSKEGDGANAKGNAMSRTTWIILGSCLGVLAIAAGTAALMQSRNNANLEEQADEHERDLPGPRPRPPVGPPSTPAATDEAVNSLVDDQPGDVPGKRE